MRRTFLFLTLFIFLSAPARAHCDTMEGPVIMDARAALESGDSVSVLAWVKASEEKRIARLFEKALAERKAAISKAKRGKIEMKFFEELVRTHRAGEGAPYTGVKMSEIHIPPAIKEADEVVESGDAEKLVAALKERLEEGLRSRSARVAETKPHRLDSVKAGREYVEAYVDFIHFVERVHEAVEGKSEHHGASPERDEEKKR